MFKHMPWLFCASIAISGCAGKHNIPAGPTMDLVAVKYDVGLRLGQLNAAYAESGMRDVLELAPRFAEAHYNLAIALTHQARWDEALSEFNAALEIEPNFKLASEGRELAKYAVANGQLPANAGVPRYCKQFHRLFEEGC
jgi:lipoprotein NlpI